jgi:hypothetical protein
LLGVRRSVRQKVVAGAAVAVLVGGGAFAAVSATGQRNGSRRLQAGHAAHRLHRQDLIAAAAYLGIAPARLRKELRSGKTLARLADATPGRSSAGLVDALVGARKQRLAAAVAAGRVTRARAARREELLRTRIGLLVRRAFVRAGNRR